MHVHKEERGREGEYMYIYSIWRLGVCVLVSNFCHNLRYMVMLFTPAVK